MTILAVDTSSRAASCALLRDGVLAGECYLNIGLTHSQTIMPLVQSLLAHTGAAIGDVDIFAVATGPGSFTGLRIGIATVKGLALALDKPCAGVSTLRSLAENLPLFEGYIAPVMDARRGQFYTALFRREGGCFSCVAQDLALSIDELRERLAPLPAPVALVGDGAALVAEQLSALPGLRLVPEHLRHQRAAGIAVLATGLAARGQLVSADTLAPLYLRLSQAERELAERDGARETHPKEEIV